MADLDYRIILGSRPIPSLAEQRDQQTARQIQQQEVELRRQEILARRDALREQARMRAMPPPVDEAKAFELRISKAKTLANLLRSADAETYPHVRELARKLVGDDAVQELPEQFDAPTVAALAKFGDDAVAQAVKTREVRTRKADGSETIQIVEDKPGQVFESAAEPPKAATSANPTEASLALLAANGDKGAARALEIMRRQKATAGSGGPRLWINRDGKTLRVSESEIRPGDTPMNTREQGRPVTSGDAGRIADLDTSLNDIATLTKTIPAGTTGTAAKVGASVPNWFTEWTGVGATAKSKQAVIDRVKQVIGKALEGGVLRKEDEYKYEKILPTIGDVDSVVASKLQGLEAAIRQRRQTTLDALEDAGYDTGRFNARGAKADPLGIR